VCRRRSNCRRRPRPGRRLAVPKHRSGAARDARRRGASRSRLWRRCSQLSGRPRGSSPSPAIQEDREGAIRSLAAGEPIPLSVFDHSTISDSSGSDPDPCVRRTHRSSRRRIRRRPLARVARPWGADQQSVR
jgi:hypothetical protein